MNDKDKIKGLKTASTPKEEQTRSLQIADVFLALVEGHDVLVECNACSCEDARGKLIFRIDEDGDLAFDHENNEGSADLGYISFEEPRKNHKRLQGEPTKLTVTIHAGFDWKNVKVIL